MGCLPSNQARTSTAERIRVSKVAQRSAMPSLYTRAIASASAGVAGRARIRRRSTRARQDDWPHMISRDRARKILAFAGMPILPLVDRQGCLFHCPRGPPPPAGSAPHQMDVRRSAGQAADRAGQDRRQGNRRQAKYVDAAYQARGSQPNIFSKRAQGSVFIANARRLPRESWG